MLILKKLNRPDILKSPQICDIITSRNRTKSEISMFRRTLKHNTSATNTAYVVM